MATPEGGITAGVTSVPSDTGANLAVGATSPSPTTQDTFSAPSSTAGNVSAEDVQGSQPQPTPEPDQFADLPSVDELREQARQGIKYADALANIKGAFDPLKADFKDLKSKYSVFEPVADRFQSPDQLQKVIELQDSIIGWANDPQTGEPVPSTELGAQRLAEQYPLHADYLTADLLELPTRDPQTGQTVPRIDVVLAGIAADAEQRAHALQILGAVDASSVRSQWQLTDQELATAQEIIRPELLDTYKKLSPEERGDLILNSPETLNRVLGQMKLAEDLQADRERYQQVEQERQQQEQQYIAQQAQAASEQYVQTQLSDALSTFHQSVVQQCQFIQPLDMTNLPQGVTAEQATQMNQQIVASNKAEAAQITGLVVSLFNPQTAGYVVPLLKEIGAVDDKLLGDLDKAAHAFGSNARNYGYLNFQGQLGRNGNYQPTADVTQLGNEANRALKTMVAYANQIRARLMERRSQFFELKAQQHNSTLNGGPMVRPAVNGTGFNPTTARIPRPSGWMSRDEILRTYGG